MQAYALTIEKKSHRVALTAEKFGINLATTRKYLNMTADDTKALDNPTVYKKRLKPVGAANHLNIIYKMIKDGYNAEMIFWYIKYKGFNGTNTQLKKAIDYIAKNNFDIVFGRLKDNYIYKIGSIVISRNDLLKEITSKNPKYRPNKIIQENLKLIEEKYPIVKTVKEIFDDFYTSIMGDDPNKLDEFISKYESKKDETDESNNYESPIPSFINGLKKDITPAKNAISFPESSGFVEGNNNKFKLIKRIVYGRANLVNLFNKCYLCFLFKRVNFTLKGAYSLAKKYDTIL